MAANSAPATEEISRSFRDNRLFSPPYLLLSIARILTPLWRTSSQPLDPKRGDY